MPWQAAQVAAFVAPAAASPAAWAVFPESVNKPTINSALTAAIERAERRPWEAEAFAGQRGLENKIREHYSFSGVPISIFMRKK